MHTLQSLLISFDRKERHALLDKIFEDKIRYFSKNFIASLKKATGIDIPSSYIWFIDYHLDWIEAAIFYHLNKLDTNKIHSIHTDGNESYPKFTLDFTQRDIDFLVYFKVNGCSKFIMVEAKYDTNWDNKQFNIKANRLKTIYNNYTILNDKLKSNILIEFYYILMSPMDPKKLQNCKGWKWIELPQGKDLYTVSRCNDENKSITGNCWSCFQIKGK
jgi:hypothetical protein